MANEITFTASLSVYKPSIMTAAVGRSVNGLTFNMAGIYYVDGSVTVATSATLIPMGQVTQPHFAYFRNLDPTNYLTIFNGMSGADVIRLLPGEADFVTLDPQARTTRWRIRLPVSWNILFAVCET